MRIPGPALVLPLLFLTGCALPPAVTVASLVLDGASYVATGKSTTDHAISAVANEDCALLRAIDGEDICDPNGEVLLALVAGDPADENWNYDPESGSPDANRVTGWKSASVFEAAVVAEPEARPELSAIPVAAKTLGEAASATPALTPGPVGQGTSLISPVSATSVAAKAPARGKLAQANPAPKPDAPQPPVQTASQSARLIPPVGPGVAYAVIGSFQNVENARRMVASRGDDALIQEIEVKGETTYRILLDQPVEQARNAGFPDAWPVHLCSSDLIVPPCGRLVVGQAEMDPDTIAN